METPEEKAEHIVLEAERSKARIFEVSGKPTGNLEIEKIDKAKQNDQSYAQALLIDDSYLVMGSQLEPKIRLIIEQGGYVDLAKLLPRDRVEREEDNRLEHIIKGGQTFLVPAADQNLAVISNFARWEQAFRNYMNVFARVHPGRVTELIQYIHVIEIASSSFPWDNVYRYDKELSLNPQCNWGIILQQAWSLFMREKNGNAYQNHTRHNPNNKGNGNGSGKNNGNKRICYKFNQGKCTYGFACKFEHKCEICAKYRHGAYSCRKLMNNVNNGGGSHDRDDRTHHHEKKSNLAK